MNFNASPLLLAEMADSCTCKGGRKTAGSNKPAASKESRTETRINPPAELPKLGKELAFSFCGGGWGRGDEPGCQSERVQVQWLSASHSNPPVLGQKKPQTPRSCREPVPGSGRAGDGLSLWRGVQPA